MHLTKKDTTILAVLATISVVSVLVGAYIRIHKPSGPVVQASSMQQQERRSAVSDVPETDAVAAKPSGVSASTSAFVVDSHDHEQHEAERSQVEKPSDEGQPEVPEGQPILDENDYLDENGNVTDWEKWCLAQMYKHGWFKPEDVPILYQEPPSGQSPGGHPAGVYIRRQGKVEVRAPRKPPPHIEARNRELYEELMAATDQGQGKRVVEITRELGELNRPYKGGGSALRMQMAKIPQSWQPYFRAIWQAELEALRQEGQRVAYEQRMTSDNTQ